MVDFHWFYVLPYIYKLVAHITEIVHILVNILNISLLGQNIMIFNKI